MVFRLRFASSALVVSVLEGQTPNCITSTLRGYVARIELEGALVRVRYSVFRQYQSDHATEFR